MVNRVGHQPSLWFPIALLVVIQLILALQDGSPLRDGTLMDPDAYMRLVRVEALYETGDWYDSHLRRNNAPYGETMHWTRPLDLLLLAGAVPLAPVLGFKTALYWWGVLISPVLFALTLLALFWAAQPLLARQGLIYVCVLAVVQPAILWYFAAGRPDHHSLIGLLFVVLLGFVLRIVARPYAPRTAVAAGVAAAALLWVSVEGLLSIAFALAAMGLGWIAWGETFVRKNAVFSLALSAGLAIALLAERPWDGLGAEEYDRLSVVHVFVFGAIAVYWLAAWALERHTAFCAGAGGRALVAAAGVAAAGGAVWFAFPKFFGGPLVDIDPRVIAQLFPQFFELRPLVVPGDPGRSLLHVVFVLGPALLAGPFLLHLLWRRGAEEWRAWMCVGLGLLMFFPLTFYQMRWATYAEFLLVLPYAALLVRALDALDGVSVGEDGAAVAEVSSTTRAGRSLARGLVVTAFATGFWMLTVVILLFIPHAAGKGAYCPVTAMTTYLDDAFGERPRRILSFNIFAAEILYRTPHEVIGTGSHRNVTGTIDTYDIFYATDDRAARAIVERRGIHLILICPSASDLIGTLPADGGTSFYRRLENGVLPGWLRLVPLPAYLEAFRLFEVIEQNLGGGAPLPGSPWKRGKRSHLPEST